MDETTKTVQSCVVLFSGGQDSTTCLAWALSRFDQVSTFGVDYGQRHRVELDVRGTVLKKIADNFPQWAAKLRGDHLIEISALNQLSDTSLTRDVAIEIGSTGLPNTFVPGRNIIFVTFAAALAYGLGAKHLVTGVCETDYSGYPDCRDDAMKALQVALNIGMEARFVIHTPLMWRDKAATWVLAEELGGRQLVEVIRDDTHTCYEGDRSHWHPWGAGCGKCPACDLRRTGFEQYQRRAGRVDQ